MIVIAIFLLCDATLAPYLLSSYAYLSVCLSVCLSHAGIMSKLLNVESQTHFEISVSLKVSLECLKLETSDIVNWLAM